MAQKPQQSSPIVEGEVRGRDPIPESYRALVHSFRRSLLAENKSPRTLVTYGGALTLFERFLVEQGMPLEVAHIRREHVEAFIADLLARYRPATAANRYRALHVFFRWCLAEGEIARSPMQRMQPPAVPVVPPAVLTDDELRRLFRACAGTRFRDRRDLAVLRLLLDSGMRISELAGIQRDDLDLEYNVVAVLGKNRRPRLCPFGKAHGLGHNEERSSDKRQDRLRREFSAMKPPWFYAIGPRYSWDVDPEGPK